MQAGSEHVWYGPRPCGACLMLLRAVAPLRLCGHPASSNSRSPYTPHVQPHTTIFTRALVIPLVLVGCGKEPPPTKVRAKILPPVVTTAQSARDAGAPSYSHVVQEGETLWAIARAYNTTIAAISEANHLSPADATRLRDGVSLVIPGATQAAHVETAAERKQKREARPALKDGIYHDVSPGETLWTLASSYDVEVDAIMERNNLDDESASHLQVGTTLIIPGVDAKKVSEAPKTPPVQRGVTHKMAAGETIWDLARIFQVGAGEIMAANGLNDIQVTKLREGEAVFIPGVEKDIKGQVRRTASARERRADVMAQRLGLGTRKVGLQLLRGRVERRWMKAAGGERKLEGYLRWPVTKGWYVRGYGSGEGGYHLATDIMGKIGWNVRAAAAGIVAYSGTKLRGYGNSIVVVHPGGWVTMYAHNSVNFVHAGEKVKRGTILAEVGSTGISRGPHVHFEFIYDGRNCDPSALFRPGIQHRKGNHSKIEQVTWRDPKKRPKAVRCDPRRRHPHSRWVVNESPEEDGP